MFSFKLKCERYCDSFSFYRVIKKTLIQFQECFGTFPKNKHISTNRPSAERDKITLSSNRVDITNLIRFSKNRFLLPRTARLSLRFFTNMCRVTSSERVFLYCVQWCNLYLLTPKNLISFTVHQTQ